MNITLTPSTTGSTDEIKSLPFGQYLLQMQDTTKENSAPYWAVGTLSKGGNANFLVIDGHFDFDYGDSLIAYAKLP